MQMVLSFIQTNKTYSLTIVCLYLNDKFFNKNKPQLKHISTLLSVCVLLLML